MYNSITKKIEYYLFDNIINLTDKIKNTEVLKKINEYRSYKIKLHPILDNSKYLSTQSYDRFMEVDEINNYTILKFSVDQTKSLTKMAKECLLNILNKKKVLLNNKPVKMKDCVILDVLNTSLFKTNFFHTDFEYSNFTGNCFNVWYLTENNENYGNIFLLETDEYKKEYTPCALHREYKGYLIPVKRNPYLSTLQQLNGNVMGYLNQKNIKITYLNMKNCECLVMSKHVLHTTDLLRDGNVKGFNFRVIVKNKDGSINYNNKYKQSDKFPNHKWDIQNKKLYGVELLDFC